MTVNDYGGGDGLGVGEAVLAVVDQLRREVMLSRTPILNTNFTGHILFPGRGRCRLRPTTKRSNSFDLEDLMNDRMFDSPVFVKSGNTLIQEIACVEDALEFLYEWPSKRRGPIYETALRACQRAFESSYPLSSARQAFSSFAKSVKILEEVTTPLPWMAGPKHGHGGMVA